MTQQTDQVLTLGRPSKILPSEYPKIKKYLDLSYSTPKIAQLFNVHQSVIYRLIKSKEFISYLNTAPLPHKLKDQIAPVLDEATKQELNSKKTPAENELDKLRNIIKTTLGNSIILTAKNLQEVAKSTDVSFRIEAMRKMGLNLNNIAALSLLVEDMVQYTDTLSPHMSSSLNRVQVEFIRKNSNNT